MDTIYSILIIIGWIIVTAIGGLVIVFMLHTATFILAIILYKIPLTRKHITKYIGNKLNKETNTSEYTRDGRWPPNYFKYCLNNLNQCWGWQISRVKKPSFANTIEKEKDN